MFKVRILGAPKPETADERKKREDAAKKAGKETRTRSRATVLAAFDVDTDNAAEVTKIVANTIAKQAADKQKAVVTVQMSRVGGVDPAAVTW